MNPRRLILPLIFVFILLAICAVSRYSPETLAQEPTPASCCGKKPALSDPAYSTVFTGQVAVATCYSNPSNAPNDFVLGVVDLKNQSTAPTNQNFAPPMYHGPAAAPWTRSRLGNIFGLTLDDQGNIYTTPTTAYPGPDTFPTGATGGTIYKINGVTGAITTFQTLPNTGGAGLGNINFDCLHRKFYVSDIDNGLIYRLDANGAILSTWDHGANLPTATPSSAAILEDTSKAFTPLGRRIWGIQANNGQLYYAVWWEDRIHPNATHQTEVWSIALDPSSGVNSGNFMGSARLEISLPAPPPGGCCGTNTMPISDISFGPTGTMLLAERSMSDETNPGAHNSRVLEYTLVGTVWTLLNPTKFKSNPNRPWSAAGGVDYDFAPGGLVWSTDDALHYPSPPSIPPETDYIYGLEGLPQSGGDTHTPNSVLIDLDGDTKGSDKLQLGDVEIPCPPAVVSSCKAEFAATAACPTQATSFTDLSSSASSWNWNFGDSSTSTQQNPTHVYAAAGNYTVTLSINGGACMVTHTVTVPAAPPPPVINGPATACQSGIYSISAQPGSVITWNVTNGTPSTGTGSSINVTWNQTGNGLVAVTVTNPDTCCKTTAQLLVKACDISSACCKDVQLDAVLKSFVTIGGGLYTFTPTLTVTSGLGNITQVSATVISSSLTFAPATCGTNGPVNSYITSAASPTGFTSSLPVPFSRDVIWTASSSAGVNLSGGLAFPFDIQFPLPPSAVLCKDNLTFCVKYTFTDDKCRSCEIIRCYGPFTRGGGIIFPSE